jgi:FkbM family methyltransferase
MPSDLASRYEPHNLMQEYRRLNAHNTAQRLTLRDGIEFSLHPDTREGCEVFCMHPSPAREMDNFIRAARNRRRLLDVGALHGTFSLVFTTREGTEALAIEPSPLALPGLRANCRLNPRHNIRIHEGAVGAEEALIRMRHDGLHFIGADLVPHGPEPAMVKIVSGDELLADQRFAPDMIKIDVEGYEQQVLTGLNRTFDYFKPDLHLEVHGPWLTMFGASLDAIVALLRGHGYRISLMDGRELDEVDLDELRPLMFHMFRTHKSTAWADRVRGCR